MDCMDFNAVDAGFLNKAGCFAEGVDDIIDLLHGDRPCHDVVCPAVRQYTGCCRQILRVDDRACEFIQDFIFREHGQRSGERH